MPHLIQSSVGIVDPAQATTLSVLVDLEARWENLKKSRSQDPQAGFTLQDLQSRQKAYEAFRAKLTAYNKRFKPAHVPELLLNTPARLGLWCRSMRDLYLQLANDLQGHCPVNLVEKAYRWADQLAKHLGKPPMTRPTPPATIQAAIGELETVSKWCDSLAGTTV